jgi:hypothetical protein
MMCSHFALGMRGLNAHHGFGLQLNVHSIDWEEAIYSLFYLAGYRIPDRKNGTSNPLTSPSSPT